MLTIPDLLLPAEVTKIQTVMDEAAYDDGRVTARGMAIDVKANRQVSRRWPGIAALDSIIEAALLRSKPFREQCSPSGYSQPLYAAYGVGASYGPHVDAVIGGIPPLRQDLSMTIFLSPKESYSGGELCLHAPLGGRHTVKLDAGAACVYPTHFIHEVIPVTAGERRVAVLWIQSFFRDADIRGMVADLRRCVEAAKAVPGADPLPISKVLGDLERKFIGS
ncbi:MAG: Fe2+-dependent dioxygenase [Planctomycetia bacterium]